MIQREETPHYVRLSDERCTFVFERLRPGVMRVTITGYDQGTLGTTALDEITAEVSRYAPVEVFIDAAGARGAAWEVSRSWTQWFRSNREQLAYVHVLTGSKHLHQTIAVSKELSRTGGLIRIYSDPDRFAAALRSSLNAAVG